MLDVFVSFILGYNPIELAPVEKGDQLSENIFILEHRLADSSGNKAMFSSPFG
jgi:hypothetical protein